MKYHLGLGFETIIIYDNNLPGDDSLSEILSDYISSGKVVIIDYRGRVGFQMEAYSRCLREWKKRFDWIAFIDVDEFITFSTSETNIGDFLAEAAEKGAEAVYINWMLFGDNGKLRYEPGSLIERFPTPLPLDNEANRHVKSIVRTGRGLKFRYNPHHVNKKIKWIKPRLVNDCMERLKKNLPWQDVSYRRLYIRHYVTKTIEEYVTQKIRRGAADHPAERKYSIYNMDRFYSFNERTPEKDRIFEELTSQL